MIPQPWIEAWRREAPWASAALVEQDLVLSRTIVEIFGVPELAAAFAFRGGTALHKMHLHARYSEDVDLVQTTAGPIGKLLDVVRSVLDPWLGKPKRDFHEGRVNLNYRFTSQETPPRALRLKVEINSREHFTVFGHRRVPFEVRSDWFTGTTEVTTFELDELMGTKLRALYQRKKGRDLFDLSLALDHGADPARIVHCFDRYMREGGSHVTRAMFEQNLHDKRERQLFRGDLDPLLRTGLEWNADAALDRVLGTVIARLPGEPWAGEAAATTPAKR